MKTAVIHSVCECQARLGAEVDENRVVLRGWAREPRRGEDVDVAPANAIGVNTQRFDVGWLCPFCGRNSLRSFNVSALGFREAVASR